MDLALYDTYRALIDTVCSILLGISLHQSFSSVHGKTLGETVTADSHNANFYFG
jgi:hypothetical protein